MKRRNVADREAARAAEQATSRSAADRIQAVVLLAAPYAQEAANRFVPLARAAGGRAAPLVVSAAGRVRPLSSEALRRVSPYGKQAVVLLVPYAQQAAGQVAPLAQTARQRGRATLAAARGELSLPEAPRSKGGVWPKRLAVFSGAAGVGVLVARKLLGSKDADWTAAPATGAGVVTDPAPATSTEVPAATSPDPGEPIPDTSDTTPADATGTGVVEDAAAAEDSPGDGASGR